jgi:plastocyanin
VQSRDSHGNAKGGVTIDWAVDSGGGSITPPQNATQANGNATATRTLGAGTGVQTATATAAALPAAPSVKFRTTAAIATTVQVADFSFTPSTLLNIPTGTTITWQWQGTTALHNVTFDAVAGAPAAIPNATSGSGQRQFNTAGTFTYSCTNHAQMTGSITVVP